MRDYKKLNIWIEAMDLCTNIYQIVQSFPKEEVYGLTSQIKRSAISIPSNIAEGAGRNSDKEFKNFLGYANGSCFELETQTILANRLRFITKDILNNILNKTNYIQKMIFNLPKTLK
jgi:four helix bundle protein